MYRFFIIGFFIFFASVTQAQNVHYKTGKLLYADAFDKGLKNWVVESPVAQQPKIGGNGGKLSIEVTGGATVWLNKKLSGNYVISFKRKVIVAGGERDRLSDLNMFWAATDIRNPVLFTRKGVLEEYDSLSMYYIGMGGNTNKTTRFRKYQGTGERTLLQEYTDSAHLLKANKEYFVQIVVYNGKTEMYVDGERYFSYADPKPLTTGYFGIRTTKSHQEVFGIKVYELK